MREAVPIGLSGEELKIAETCPNSSKAYLHDLDDASRSFVLALTTIVLL